MKYAAHAVLVAIALVASCAKQEDAGTTELASSADATEDRSPVDVVCSFAPSQSAVVSYIAGAGGGGAVAATAVAEAAGLSVVMHSSGGYILTGAGGYLAGTLGTAITGPVIVGFGLLVGGSAATVELLCVPKNHPEMVARVETAARDFYSRTLENVSTTASAAKPIVAEVQESIVKAGNDAFDYASRKTVEVSEAFKQWRDAGG